MKTNSRGSALPSLSQASQRMHALGVFWRAPKSVRAEGGAPNADSWGLDSVVRYDFPGTRYTTDTVVLTWYDGDQRPPAKVKELVGGGVSDQGSIYIGTEGVLYSLYDGGELPVLLPVQKFAGYKVPNPGGVDHYRQFVEAVRGNGKTSTPFSYSGPLTESVLLGCLSTRFPKTTLEWDANKMTVTNIKEANAFVRRTYRKGWEVEGL